MSDEDQREPKLRQHHYERDEHPDSSTDAYAELSSSLKLLLLTLASVIFALGFVHKHLMQKEENHKFHAYFDQFNPRPEDNIGLALDAFKDAAVQIYLAGPEGCYHVDAYFIGKNILVTKKSGLKGDITKIVDVWNLANPIFIATASRQLKIVEHPDSDLAFISLGDDFDANDFYIGNFQVADKKPFANTRVVYCSMQNSGIISDTACENGPAQHASMGCGIGISRGRDYHSGLPPNENGYFDKAGLTAGELIMDTSGQAIAINAEENEVFASGIYITRDRIGASLLELSTK